MARKRSSSQKKAFFRPVWALLFVGLGSGLGYFFFAEERQKIIPVVCPPPQPIRIGAAIATTRLPGQRVYQYLAASTQQERRIERLLPQEQHSGAQEQEEKMSLMIDHVLNGIPPVEKTIDQRFVRLSREFSSIAQAQKYWDFLKNKISDLEGTGYIVSEEHAVGKVHFIIVHPKDIKILDILKGLKIDYEIFAPSKKRCARASEI